MNNATIMQLKNELTAILDKYNVKAGIIAINIENKEKIPEAGIWMSGNGFLLADTFHEALHYNTDLQKLFKTVALLEVAEQGGIKREETGEKVKN